MEFTEEQLIAFSKPLSETEGKKCENAIRIISNALKNIGYSEKQEIQVAYKDTFAYETRLKKNNTEIKLLVQGSYANNTNVRAESDVDIAVIQEDVFNTKYRVNSSEPNFGFTKFDSNYGISTVDYTFKDYKKNIYDILVKEFDSSVEWKNKCLFVQGNSYRVDADTVPARRYRDYTNDYSNDVDNYIGGIRLQSDEGDTITNFPEQHIKNGRNKNQSTNSFYKKMVRIIKRIRYIMMDEQIESAFEVSSFALESLLWNISDYKYTIEGSYSEKFQGIINYLIYISVSGLDSYKEANGIKKLCKDSNDKKNLINFIEDLQKFYKSYKSY